MSTEIESADGMREFGRGRRDGRRRGEIKRECVRNENQNANEINPTSSNEGGLVTYQFFSLFYPFPLLLGAVLCYI